MVSGFGWGGTPGEVVDYALDAAFIPVTSRALLDEFDRVIREPHLADRFTDPDILVELWLDACSYVEPAVTFERVEGDDHVLEAAYDSGATFIVAGDGPLLSLKEHFGTRIVNASDFVGYMRMHRRVYGGTE